VLVRFISLMEDSELNPAASPEGEAPKKTKRPRAITTRTRAPRAKVVKASAEVAPEPGLFTPAALAPASVFEAPARVEAAPVQIEPAPAPREERPVFSPKRDTPSMPEPEPAFPPASFDGNADAPRDDHNAEASSPRDDQPSHNAGQPPAFPAPAQGGEEDRGPWWKRKKDRKKSKWQEKPPGRGGHHQAPHVAHPPQPPPPAFVPHYGDLPDPQRFTDFTALDALAERLTVATDGVVPLQLDQLYALNLGELTTQARALGVSFVGVPNRLQALEAILLHAEQHAVPLLDRGWIDLTEKGYGFIVHEQVNYRLYPENSYLPESLVRRYGLKRGHYVEVVLQTPRDGDRCPAVVGIRSVMGMPAVDISKLTPFEELVPYYPLERILLEAPEIHKDISMRAIDLLTPVGFGQRGLLVAPPRTGKTVLLQNIANSISHNFPDKKLILLLIDERPEEVTDFRRHTKGEVVSSTFDEAPESHVHAAEMVIEKARRLVELGQHVVILLDSITRLARAYNALAANSGKIMSGGVEATALQRPKRFFGSARNIEGGGSITIIATALIDTGSRMDEVIFEEFKGTGNMELHLDRGLSDKRIFPAINIDRSGTRKEELIYHPDEMARVYGLRRAMQGIPPIEAMDMLIQRLKKTKTNAEFLMSLNR
jgi:transcription termination factor Rho